ncbi:hypothetical protein [Streptomyces scabiei]|uniref:hypothetical protein n=1 Tax=Streptomyces scabiei TaxID=1930 RepID=UPI001B300844|nr:MULTISPECIES: hypothetical protein [Streptomyces]MBP5870916.1 hypothetical protein [Streptomyces sp. LBUM 1485]MBP5913180.1 hypothetical protein [Streptomyces sp. LBUM 1486]MDX2532349.1 hypothetical protein [Streptomyces scabiei]MDX2794653.1 hypothetical protein [Streptomyces scabiei]MDX3822345.1 hypothetical protein [Streptomyces scabiei]
MSADELAAAVAPEAEEPLPVAFLACRDSRVLGLYGQSEDALHHCENALGRTVGYSAATPFSWRKRPGGIRELYAWTSQEVSSATGFTVARLEVRDEFDEGWGADADVVPDPVAVLSSERPVDGLTAVFVPVASLREPEPEFYGSVHHDWRLGRDLPEGGLR